MTEHEPPPLPHPTSHGLRRTIWPRTIRPAIAAALHLRPRVRELDRVLKQSGLDESLQTLIRSVARSTRLWRSEQIDVARELVGHFLDGAAAGKSAEDLAASFGDAKQAAKLIRRAKKRNRGVIWRTWRRAWQGVGLFLALLVVLYGVATIRFYTGSPQIKRNFTAELNKDILSRPESERAWPIYLKASRAMGATPLTLVSVDSDLPATVEQTMWPQKPGDLHWKEAAEYVDSHHEAARFLREGADKPSLGFALSDVVDPEFDQILAERSPGYQPQKLTPNPNPALIGVLLPYLGEMRSYARFLTADARRAAELGDGQRFEDDIVAMVGVAEHSRESPFLISDLVSIAVLALCEQTLLDHLAQDNLLDEQRLTRLAHRLGTFSNGRIEVRIGGERRYFTDVTQRMYTDNGHGDGRMTAEGMKELRKMTQFDSPKPEFIPAALGPIDAEVSPSRAEITAVYNEMITKGEEEAATPLWKRDELKTTMDQEVEMLRKRSWLNEHRFGMVFLMVPALSSAAIQRELAQQRHDAAKTAVSIVAYKRHHGEWPKSLESMVPEFLPAVPPDRFDGKPLKYKPASPGELPVLYSVGADRKDDGGRAPALKESRLNATIWQPKARIDAWSKNRGVVPKHDYFPDGDWILWPPIKDPPQDTKQN